MITVFTPTYNRAYTLSTLYNSLLQQTNKNFEWLIVDDGSSDETEQLLADWDKEHRIKLNWIRTENQGKAAAINVGIKYAKGDVFFIVDSDDYITGDAIDSITREFAHLSEEGPYCGVCFQKGSTDGISLINTSFTEFFEASSLELAYKYHADADKAEVFFTKILKQFPFPEIEGNKFIPEGLVWNRIANAGYKFKWCTKVIYICDYLEDGYTRNFNSNLKKNPKGFALYYRELLSYSIVPLKKKLKAFLRLIQCIFYSHFNF